MKLNMISVDLYKISPNNKNLNFGLLRFLRS